MENKGGGEEEVEKSSRRRDWWMGMEGRMVIEYGLLGKGDGIGRLMKGMRVGQIKGDRVV